MKRCTKCKRKLPINKFHKARSKSDGLKCWCKDCCRIDNTKYAQTSKRKATKAGYAKSDKGRIVRARAQTKYRRTAKGYLSRRLGTMKCRCNNPKHKTYKRYGERGIKCLFTLNEFFVHATIDLGFDTIEKLKGLQIHRTNNDRHYQKGNIEFLTPIEHRARHKK